MTAFFDPVAGFGNDLFVVHGGFRAEFPSRVAILP